MRIGKLKDEATHIRRMDRFPGELIWMSTVLRYGRQTVSIVKKEAGLSTVHAANPCPEKASRMGKDALDTVLELRSTIAITGNPIGASER